jgi:hypothetical protein
MAFRFLDRYRSSPFTNGAGAAPSPRPVIRGSSSPRELFLERELAALRAEQAALARQERAAAANLADMQDSLDILAGEIDKRARAARDPDLRDRGQRMVATVKEFWSRQDDCAKTMPATVVSVMKHALGLEPLPHRFAAPPAAAAAQPAAVRATAQGIIDSGAVARNEREAPDVATGVVRKLRSDLPPVGSTARAMINADRKRRGLPPYGADE